jgi:hypothetical protein
VVGAKVVGAVDRSLRPAHDVILDWACSPDSAERHSSGRWFRRVAGWRSEWRRSASLTAGPCASLPENRKPTTACLVGLGRSPVRNVPHLLALRIQVSGCALVQQE